MISILIYAISLCDKINSYIEIPIFISLVFLIGVYVCHFVNLTDFQNEDSKKEFFSYKKILIKILIIMSIIKIICPDAKTISAMYLIPRIYNNENVKQIPDKAFIILNSKLDQWLDEIKKHK